jgi:Mn2+/Fe2+ NRAMP family transporter
LQPPKQAMNVSNNKKSSPFFAAIFLMATSAIGPGFLTQTALFTGQLLGSFGFVILVSIILDIGAQLNIWRVIAICKMRAQDIANKVLPGAGTALTIAVVLGGLAFNTGNLAGAGLGINVLTGLSTKEGAAISLFIVIGAFVSKNTLRWMDLMAKILGTVMILLTVYVVFVAKPPLMEALLKTFAPDKTDFGTIMTIVGGTVGGYITFAGGHRLLDSGIAGKTFLPQVNRSAASAILLASAMRVLLFLAALGVLFAGNKLDASNPAASMFQLAAGQTGYKIFGMVMWCAALTSVTGSAYTSISFMKTIHPVLASKEKTLLVIFVLISATIFFIVGQPVRLLVLAGLLNGFILPFALGLMLIAAYNKSLVGDYRHPILLTVFGGIVVILTLIMSITTVLKYFTN